MVIRGEGMILPVGQALTHPANDKGKDDAENGDVDVFGLEERLSTLGDGARNGFQPIVGVAAIATAGFKVGGLGERRLLAVGNGNVDCGRESGCFVLGAACLKEESGRSPANENEKDCTTRSINSA